MANVFIESFDRIYNKINTIFNDDRTRLGEKEILELGKDLDRVAACKRHPEFSASAYEDYGFFHSGSVKQAAEIYAKDSGVASPVSTAYHSNVLVHDPDFKHQLTEDLKKCPPLPKNLADRAHGKD